VTIKDIIACNGFGFKGTKRVVSHPTTLSPFFRQVFFVTSESQATFAELKFAPG